MVLAVISIPFLMSQYRKSANLNNMERTQFYKAQYPVVVISRLTGLAPFAVHQDGSTTVQISLPWLIYTLLLYGGYLYSFMICIDVSWQIPLSRNYPFISVVGHLLHIILGVFIFNVCYILNLVKAKPFSIHSDRLLEVDALLLKLASPVKNLINHQRALRLKWLCFIAVTLFFVFMFVFDYFVFRDLYDSFIYLIGVSYVLPYFTACVMMMQFMNLTHVIYERFQVINKFLLHIAKMNENYTKVTDSKEKKKFLNLHFDPDLHTKLHDIFRAHDKLCDMAEAVNDLYSSQTVVCITCIFILLLFGFFFETKVLFYAWGGATRLVFISTSYLLWGIISTLNVYLMLYLCTNTRDEANKSALIIHKILQMKPAFMLNDEVYYNKMKSFTLQILHRKNILHFNGLGLFRLDYTFIFSAVSAATSYLIVLLQFDMSNELKAFSSNKFY